MFCVTSLHKITNSANREAKQTRADTYNKIAKQNSNEVDASNAYDFM